MSFVARDKDGNVREVAPVAQPGRAEEELPDDHPDIVAYVARVNAPPAPPLSVEELLSAAEKKGALPTKDEVLAERGRAALAGDVKRGHTE